MTHLTNSLTRTCNLKRTFALRTETSCDLHRKLASTIQTEDAQSPTRDLTAFAMGGIEVNSTVIVPNRLIERLDRAAALGSVRRSRAVATAEELAPSVTPRVT